MDTAAPALSAGPAGGIPVSTPEGDFRVPLTYYATHFLGVPAPDAADLVETVSAELGRSNPRSSVPIGAAPLSNSAVTATAAEEFFASIHRAASANYPGVRRAGNRSATDTDEVSPSLAARIEGLTPKQHEAVWLRFSQGFGPKALARITGLSVRNVSFLLHSALANLHGIDEADTSSGRVASVMAYVLGEMDEVAAAAFATELKRDQTSRATVGELRALIAEITANLPHRRKTPEASRKPRAAGFRWRKPLVWAAVLVGGAATIAVTVTRWNRLSPQSADVERHRETDPMKPDAWRLSDSPSAPAERAQTASGSGGGMSSAGRPRGLAPNPPKAKSPEGDAPIALPNSGSASVGKNGVGTSETTTGGATGGASLTGATSASGGGVGSNAEVPNTEFPPSPTAASSLASPNSAPASDGPASPAPGMGAPGESASSTPSNPIHPSSQSSAASAKDNPSPLPAPTAVTPDASLAAVSALRTALAAKRWPAPEAVNVDALLEYFAPDGAMREVVIQPLSPISASVEVAATPWDPKRRLVRVVVQATPATRSALANLVLLIDVSGSMDAPNRLPLVREAVRRILHHLRPEDRVAIVAYAGEARVVLRSTPAKNSTEILAAIGSLVPKGLTHGSAGLRTAYEVAREKFVVGGLNRVVLCTDGDFNLGETSEVTLAALVEAQARAGVELDVYGFGRGRRIDPRLEALAVHGRGRSGNLNTRREAESQMAPGVVAGRAVVAQAVRVDFDSVPTEASDWSLLGAAANFIPAEARGRRSFETKRLLAGENATALFEVQPSPIATERGQSPTRLGVLRVGYTSPTTGEGMILRVPITDTNTPFNASSAELKFATAVARLGRALRTPPPEVQSLNEIVGWAERAAADVAGHDPGGYQAEFLALAREARDLAQSEAPR